MKKINIGIVAHVDAGKTTITENLLYLSGAIKKPGRVDTGDTQTDSMELEKKRGITIKTSAISYDWKNEKINILDTPGHADFVSEVERSLSILDGAVLVVSAVEGIQSQTRILFDTLMNLKIPTIIFVNKIDRAGADCRKLIKKMKKTLSDNIIALQEVFNEGNKDAVLGELYAENILVDIEECLSEFDDHVLESYINGETLDKKILENKIKFCAKKAELYPVLFGSAINGTGVENLLDAIIKYFPFTEGGDDEDLSAVVFKIDNSDINDKKVYLRLFNGKLNLRDVISTYDKRVIEKVKRISTLKNCKQIDDTCISSGDIGVIHGIKGLKIGDIIGVACNKIKYTKIEQPTIKTKIYPSDTSDSGKLFEVLKLMTEEDPLLELEVGDFKNDIFVNLFGEIQMEILQSMIEEKYGIRVCFSDTLTIYKETPQRPAEAAALFNQYLNPFRAEVGIMIEPLGEGEGLKYISQVSTGSLPKTFQNAIEESVYNTCKQGLLGWEVTDLKVTLVHGIFDSVTSTPADFRNLTPMVLMEALNKAGTFLMEPLYEFSLKIPISSSGRVMSDLQKMRADVNNISAEEEDIYIEGLIPVNTSKKYTIELNSYTEGKGIFLTKFHGYTKVPLYLGQCREKAKIDPLNKKMYISYKQNAIR